MREKNIQSLFGRQIREIGIDGIFELKLAKGKSIRWDSVRDHQIKALVAAASSGGFYYKISDAKSVFRKQDKKDDDIKPFTSRKPFDCFFFRNTQAYVVICWYVPRQRKTLYFIRIEDYVRNMDRAERKSFRETEAIEMASHVYRLRG